MAMDIPVAGCCGCSSCENACPKRAISMAANEEGFLYPRIDHALCVSCGLCETSCPIIHPPKVAENFEHSVVAQSKSDDVLNESTSGGFMDALCRYVIEEMGGYAAGVIYDKDFMPVHIVTNDYDSAKQFRNSKYAQSHLGCLFKQVKELLKKKETVLFTGTPCQVAGLKAFLQIDYDQLITADLVCRSIPSPKLWKAYMAWQEEKHQQKIERIDCRKKTYGYHSGALEIRFKGGRHYAGSNRVDYFMKCFHSDVCSRKSCYQCKFKTPHRCSDFTVFDCWNPEAVADTHLEDNDRGYSNVLIHSPKGRRLIEKINALELASADPEKMFLYTGGMERKSIAYKPQRDTFYQDLEAFGFEKAANKYVSVSAKDRLIETLKPARYRLMKGMDRCLGKRKGK